MNQINTTDPAIWLHIVTVMPILIFKITLLIIGYLITKLGYKLLVEGIKGPFKVTFKFKGFETNLVSGLPGIFFVLLAVLLMGYAVFKDMPFGTEISQSIRQSNYSNYENGKDVSVNEKPPISNSLETVGGN